MSDSNKFIKIIEPSKEIFQLINNYKKLIKIILPNAKVTLIGSFAVPMCGKEEIDLLIETDNVKEAQKLLGKHGFGIGPIINGEGFCKSNNYGIVCDLHIVSKGHKNIKKYFDVITNLKENPKILKKYEELKKSLDGSTEEFYKKAKNKFLKENILILKE
ncbi:MAG: GrpB family protein [Candidatus Nanoarchaeia archaeon]|nr:GrpB family protein [Candidatus Nanoarchaeia archaeon]